MLIDKERAIRGIKRLFKMGEHYCDEQSIIGFLNTIQSEQRWILVTERLPQTEDWRTEYIVTYRYGYKDLISDTTCMSWENTTVRGKPVSRWIWHGALSPWKVVAWMEKPKPWEGEENV